MKFAQTLEGSDVARPEVVFWYVFIVSVSPPLDDTGEASNRRVEVCKQPGKNDTKLDVKVSTASEAITLPTYNI